MSMASKCSICGIAAFGGVAVLVGYAILTARAQPGSDPVARNDAAEPKPSLADGTAEERFDTPESVVREFVSQLERIADREGTVSPALLAEQVVGAKTCRVDTVPEPTQKLPPDAIYVRARAGGVIIGAIPKAKRRHRLQPVFASGFVIHKDGVIVSNAHVIEAFRDMKAIAVMTSDGRVFPIKAVLAADRLNDVAVLKVAATNLTALPLARSVPVGTTVYCLSHPVMNCMGTENGFFAFTQGIVSGRYRTRLMGETPVNVLTITADYAQGSSGGPILNERGAVVGMVCQTLAITDDNGESQMTWKFVRPASSVRPLLQGAPPAR